MKKSKSLQRGTSRFAVPAFILFAVIAVIHVILVNIPGNYFAVTKVLLMPSLVLFFIVSVKNIKRGWYIVWTLSGIWLGNICLIWGEQSRILFVLGSAFTIIGLYGYIRVLFRSLDKIQPWFVLFQLPVIWVSGFFLILMYNSLGIKIISISLYMSLIAFISMLGLAQVLNSPRSRGAWFMFFGTLFYIAENGLYTTMHYYPSLGIGVNIVHPCFIMAQTLMTAGYICREKEPSWK